MLAAAGKMDGVGTEILTCLEISAREMNLTYRCKPYLVDDQTVPSRCGGAGRGGGNG